jgi:hypothetical protein
MTGPSRRTEHGRPPSPTVTWRGELLLAIFLFALTVAIVVPVTDGGADLKPVDAVATPSEPTPTHTASLPIARPQGDGPRDPRTRIEFDGTGELEVVSGNEEPSGPGPVRTFNVKIERGIPIDAQAFARRVQEILASPKSWGGLEGFSVRRVDTKHPDFHVILASPDTTDELCRPLDTDGIYSCQRQNRAILNAWRWFEGADAYGKDLHSYRIYMVNHEVGHVWLHPHLSCPAPGVRAPVMVQQTVGVGACKPNPWPLPSEAHDV